jgi:flavin-dependent dehydrogenase
LYFNSYDIVVAGGGPAGIVTAVKLNSMGYQVLLITPGNRYDYSGLQSLSPGVLTLINTIGLQVDQIYSSLTAIHYTRKLWSGVLEEMRDPTGFLVHRGSFDNELLNAAKNMGVQIMQPAKLIDCRIVNNEWQLQINQGGKYLSLKTKFLVDATGKKSVLRGKKNRMAPSTMAITGSWKNTSYAYISTQLESTPTHWLWGGKLSDDLFHVTVFSDSNSISGRSKLTEKYIETVEKTQLFRKCLDGSLAGKLSAVDVTPYYYEKPVSENYIKVGEAGFSFDPQSSQGVQHAMSNAIQAAIVINTILSDAIPEDIVFDFYTSRQQDSILKHQKMTTDSYASAACWKDQPFWQKRTVRRTGVSTRELQGDTKFWESATRIRISPEAILKSVACIDKDLITCKMGILHPGLDGPMVYCQNQEIDKIMKMIGNRMTVSDLVNSWTQIMPHANAVQLIHSLKRVGILEAVVG